MTEALTGGHARQELWSGPIIDVDVHAVLPGMQALLPYLDDVWVQHVTEQQWRGPQSNIAYPPGMPSTVAPRWRHDGATTATDVDQIRRDVLDAWDLDHAILNCYLAIDGGPPDFSLALAKAINDWIAHEWLEPEPRLRASIILPGPTDPAAMAGEIDRAAQHPGFVQALLPVRSGRHYGKRLFWPVFEAIERNNLVGGVHFGGSNEGLPPTPAGWPSWYVEEYAAEVQVFESQLIGMLAEGLFQKFPSLRLSFLEGGFTWLPMWMWNLDRNWKGIRREVPWLKSRPFDVVRDHIRFSAAPIDADDAEELAHVIRWIGSDDVLMFASDYPHWHDDDVAVLLDAVPTESRSKLMSENARTWYRLGDSHA